MPNPDTDTDDAVITVEECEDGLVKEVDPKGFCLEDGSAKNATFTFDVELSGSVNQDQTYYFEFSGNGITPGEVKLLKYTINGETKDVPVEDGKGQFTVKEKEYPEGGEFSVQADVVSNDKLKETDSLTLTIDNKEFVEDSETAKTGEALIGNFEDCVIDGLVQDIMPTGACIDDGNANKAIFAYSVRLSAAYNQEQEYFYDFKGNKDLDDYEVLGIYVNGQLARAQGASGSFIIPKGEAVSTKGFTVAVEIKAKDVLDGEEALTLSLSNEPKFKPSETKSATVEIANFNDCGIDGLVQAI